MQGNAWGNRICPLSVTADRRHHARRAAPEAPGLVVVRNLRGDQIARMEARRQISEAQFAAGPHYQSLHEIAFASALRSCDLTRPVIDKGHRVADPLSGRQQDAIRRLRLIDGTLAVRLGIDALMLVHAVLLGGRSVVDASCGLPKAKASYWRTAFRFARDRGARRARHHRAQAPAGAGALRPAGRGDGSGGGEGRALILPAVGCPTDLAKFFYVMNLWLRRASYGIGRIHPNRQPMADLLDTGVARGHFGTAAARFCVARHPMNPSSVTSDPESLDLSGVQILVVEDSWHLGKALKSLLETYGAEVAGPVATSADAQRLVFQQPPDAALVDFSLRNGERADVLLDRLHEQGIYVIVTSGYDVLPVAARRAGAILQKPISAATLLGSLRPVVARTKS